MNISGKRGPTSTPCRGVCTTTALGDDICKGCLRTAYEVLHWNSFTNSKKVEINKRIKAKELK